MEKIVLVIASIFCVSSYSQKAIGIHTSDPKATLDIAALPNNYRFPDGIIAPRLEGNVLKNMGYNSYHEGVIIYVTKPVTSPMGPTQYVNKEGYYYFNGSQWINFMTNGNSNGGTENDINMYNTNGAINEDRIVDLNGKTLEFKSTNDPDNNFVIKGNTNTAAIKMNLSQSKNISINSPNDGDAVLSVKGSEGDKILKLENIDDSFTSRYTQQGGYFNEKKITSLVIDESGDVIQQYTPTLSSSFPNSYTVNSIFNEVYDTPIVIFDNINASSFCYFKVLYVVEDDRSTSRGVNYGEITFNTKDGFKILNQTGTDVASPGVVLENGVLILGTIVDGNAGIATGGTLTYSNGNIYYTNKRQFSPTCYLYIYEGIKL